MDKNLNDTLQKGCLELAKDVETDIQELIDSLEDAKTVYGDGLRLYFDLLQSNLRKIRDNAHIIGSYLFEVSDKEPQNSQEKHSL